MGWQGKTIQRFPQHRLKCHWETMRPHIAWWCKTTEKNWPLLGRSTIRKWAHHFQTSCRKNMNGAAIEIGGISKGVAGPWFDGLGLRSKGAGAKETPPLTATLSPAHIEVISDQRQHRGSLFVRVYIPGPTKTRKLPFLMKYTAMDPRWPCRVTQGGERYCVGIGNTNGGSFNDDIRQVSSECDAKP